MSASEKTTLKVSAIRSRALSGIKALTLRTLASQALRVVSSLCLARLLFPKDFGVFAVAGYLSGFGMFLGDVGLSGALVRQHEEPKDDELFTVFVCQQALTGLIVALLIVASPFLVHLYGLSSDAALLLSAMAVSLFLNSLRLVPMLVLERELRFTTIACCELIENVALTAGTIGLAFLHTGAWAFVGGILLRGGVGLACIWAASPYRPRGRFRFSIVRQLVGFGSAFQLNALMPTLVAGWMPLVVGRILGTVSVGFVGWATNLASTPLMLSAVLNRVAFPAYSRLHADSEAFGNALIASVRRLSAVFWLLVPIGVLVCPVVIPALFGPRWNPAIGLVQWFGLQSVLLTLTGLLASAQNASGRAAERLGVTIGVGAAQWTLGFLAVAKIGLAAIGPLLCAISLAELLVTTLLVQRRNPGCQALFREIFGPLTATTLLLAVSIGVGRAAGHGRVLSGTVCSLLLFIALAAVREMLPGGSRTAGEMRAVVAMLRLRHQEGEA
ncbi:MAG TPA: oligosaccharide flippase family protein [Chthonomonadaceae bacterium]|nr:oligosaccharide flippase family protein [Chthonomonadaceae bacterium]